MSNHTKSPIQSAQLRSGFIYLMIWLVVLMEEIRIFSGDGLQQQIERVQAGNYYPIFVISCSVILLSMVFRGFVLYFKKSV